MAICNGIGAPLKARNQRLRVRALGSSARRRLKLKRELEPRRLLFLVFVLAALAVERDGIEQFYNAVAASAGMTVNESGP
jgi:hypothetical protein